MIVVVFKKIVLKSEIENNLVKMPILWKLEIKTTKVTSLDLSFYCEIFFILLFSFAEILSFSVLLIKKEIFICILTLILSYYILIEKENIVSAASASLQLS